MSNLNKGGIFIMHAIKIFLLELLLLFVLCFFGTIVMNVFGMVLNVDYSNTSGIKVGFCSWIILLISDLFLKLTNKKK